MNPKDFSWTEDQQVTVSNPTPEPFKFKVHNKEYEVGAGRTAKMPGYIAWVYVYNLASQLAQADGAFNAWNEEGFRQQYFSKIVVGVDQVVQSVEIEPGPVIETLDDDEDIESGSLPQADEEPDDDEAEDSETEEPDSGDTTENVSDDTSEDSDPTPELEAEGAVPANIQPMTSKPKAKASSRGRSASV